jgi:hypothetical protein
VTAIRRKTSPPETLAQAAEWERAKARYVSGGLCEVCAGQAAWGHQQGAGGWSALKPPCPPCAVVIEGFPMATSNPLWRKSPRHPLPHRGALTSPTACSGAEIGALSDLPLPPSLMGRCREDRN